MNLKKLLLLKLVCCGGPLLVLVLSSVGLAEAMAMLAGASWSIVGIVPAFVGVLLWRFGRRLPRSRPGKPETMTRTTSSL